MPQATPKRAGRSAKAGSRFPAEVLAANVRDYRQLRGLSQEQLAQKMAELGHPWTAGIVGFVERGDRNVTVDELVGLAFCLGFHPGKLLDPAGVLGLYGGADVAGASQASGLDIGLAVPLSQAMAGAWLSCQVAAGPNAEGDVHFRPVPPWLDEDDVGVTLSERAAQICNTARAGQLAGTKTKGKGKR